MPYIDDVNIHLTGVAFAGSRIFTLSTFDGAIQTRGRLGQHRASNIAIATRFRDPGHLPPAPGPGSRAAGSSQEEPAATLRRQLTRGSHASDFILVGETDRVQIGRG